MTDTKPAPQQVHDLPLRVFLLLQGALQLLALALASTAARHHLLLLPPFHTLALVTASLVYPLLVVRLRRSTHTGWHVVLTAVTVTLLCAHVLNSGWTSGMGILSALMVLLMFPTLAIMLTSSQVLRKTVEISGVFEIHITVKNDTSQPQQQELDFAEACEVLKVKFVRISLPKGEHPLQLMTSSYVAGTSDAAVDAARRLAQSLQEHGFTPIRVKVEALISNEGVAEFALQDMTEQNYFEFHLKTVIRPGQDVSVLEGLCKEHDAHFSRNAFARKSDGTEHRFLTIRKHTPSKEEAERCCDLCIEAVENAGFTVLSTEREFAVFDSNLTLDSGWLKAY